MTRLNLALAVAFVTGLAVPAAVVVLVTTTVGHVPPGLTTVAVAIVVAFGLSAVAADRVGR